MRIGELASTCDCPVETIRYYEKIGLLAGIRRDCRGHRFYDERDLPWIEMIKRLKATAMPLDEIRRFAVLRGHGDATIPERLALLEAHAARIEAQMRGLEEHRRKIDEKITRCKQGGSLSAA